MAIITQDGNYTVKLYNRNGSVISDNYKLSEIIADLIASGYDCNALTLHQYSSYGYGSLVAFKVIETGLYYVGDNDLKSGLGNNATLFQKDNITFNQHFYTYTDGSPVDRGAISLSTQTINGVEYYYDYDGNVKNEPIIYVDSSISLVVNYTGTPSGGAGSGYIGNSLLSNKKMVGYNVPTSSAEGTKTESVNDVSVSAVSGKPKSGNGFARIKLVQSAQQKVDASASNQLKNNGVSPTVIMGTLGEYDSQTQSYYFSDVCSFSYSNAKISKSDLQNAKRLYLEMELRLDNASVGINIDATIHIRYGTDGYRILGVVAGNGESGTGDYSFFWMNNGTVQKNDTAPLDVSANRGAFHKVKFELLMSNGTVTTMNCYLDGVLYKTKSVNEAFVLDYDEYIIYCDIIKYAYAKSYKVEVV